MRVEQEKVECFHDKMQYTTNEKPTLVDIDLARQRYHLILEELGEYAEAAEARDIVKIADAIADMLYVVLGTAVVHGIDVQPIFDEVHRSNMTKDQLDPVTKKGGKCPGYEPPRIAELLLIQSTGVGNAV
jgi:predicted HAD superfamily Cof-like phosphohydrolase